MPKSYLPTVVFDYDGVLYDFHQQVYDHAADNNEHLPPLDTWVWNTPAEYIKAHPELYETFKARYHTPLMKALWSFREAGFLTVVATDRPDNSVVCPSIIHPRTVILFTNGDKVKKIRDLEHEHDLYLVGVFEDAPHHLEAMFEDCMPVVPIQYPWNTEVINKYLNRLMEPMTGGLIGT